eukprot:scaffold27325_cov243-Isochrysis_galbana.AAC.8
MADADNGRRLRAILAQLIGGSLNWEDGRSTGKVFSVGAAQNVGRFWCRYPARLLCLWASGGHLVYKRVDYGLGLMVMVSGEVPFGVTTL